MTSRANITLLAGAIWLSFGACAIAASDSMPQNGAATYATYFTCHQLDVIDMGEIGSQSTSDCVGVTKSSLDQKIFDNMSAHCLEDDETRGGKSKFAGWCSQIDGDGDKIFVSYNGSLDGTISYIGGTGKYKGISGSGTWSVNDAPSLGTGQFAFVLGNKVNWQIK
jgi:hypothetical protein